MTGKLRVAVVACFLLTCCFAYAQSLTVYPNPIQFGTVALNSPSSPIYVYLSDTGTSAIDVTSITISGTNSHDFTLSAPSCVGTIPSGSYCLTLMTFTPSAMGARSASLVVAVNGVTTPVTIAITGAGGNPIPTITSLSPASIYVNSAATTITINGTGFVSSSLAYFGNSQQALTTTYVSATQLKAIVPASDLSQTGEATIFVETPPPAGGSFGANLQVVSQQPTINNASPSSVVAGTNPGPIVLNGENFMTGATVQWNGVNVPATYVSPNELTIAPTVAELGTPAVVELSVTNPSPGIISSTSIFNVTSPDTITVLDLPANDLVWDPFAQVIYASVPSSYGANGNSIAVINPTTGAVTGYHFAGSEPTKMALSATSNYLYVGLNGNGSIQRLDLPAFTKDIDINLSTNTSINAAYDIKVSPANAHTIAVAAPSTVCCYSSELEFFTDSTKLANFVTTEPVQQIVFPTGATLYGYNNGTLSEVAVSSTGGTLSTTWSNIVSGSTIAYAGGLIYGSSGQAFNPATGLLLGTYDVAPTYCCATTVQVWPNSSLNRVFAVGQTSFFSSFSVTSYNLTQFTPVAVASLAELESQYNSSSASNLIQWGASGLAFTVQLGCCNSPSNQVVLVTSPALLLTATRIVSPPPVQNSLNPASATHGGGNFVLIVHGSNFVPGSTVTWGGKSVFADYLNPTQLKVYVPKADIAIAGSVQVVVKNPAPGGGKSNILTFAVK